MGAPYTISELRDVLVQKLQSGGAKEAFLFGSHARGEADELSDVDLAVVAETGLPFLERYRAFASVFDAVPEVEMWVYTPLEWETMAREQSPFYLGIAGSCVPLLSSSASDDAATFHT